MTEYKKYSGGGGGDRGRSGGGSFKKPFNASRNDSRGGGKFGGGNRGGGDRPSDRSEMHKATCADCKKSCEVPFRPTGEKPVFCRDCFDGKREGAPRNQRDSRNNEYSAPRSNSGGDDKLIRELKSQIEETNRRLSGLILAVEKISSFVESSTKKESLRDVMTDVGIISEAKVKKIAKTVSKSTLTKKPIPKKVAVKKKPTAKKTARK